MAKMIVELSEDEVEQAVREWAEKHHGLKVGRFIFDAHEKRIGNGPHETKVHVPYVKFETS